MSVEIFESVEMTEDLIKRIRETIAEEESQIERGAFLTCEDERNTLNYIERLTVALQVISCMNY